jgi:hypothetical protein
LELYGQWISNKFWFHGSLKWLEVVVLKPIKKIVFIWSREYLESLIFDVFEKWIAKITKVHFLAKIWLNFGEFITIALKLLDTTSVWTSSKARPDCCTGTSWSDLEIAWNLHGHLLRNLWLYTWHEMRHCPYYLKTLNRSDNPIKK